MRDNVQQMKKLIKFSSSLSACNPKIRILNFIITVYLLLFRY